MAENVDVKAGIKHILERIEVASKTRPSQVKSSLISFLNLFISVFNFLV